MESTRSRPPREQQRSTDADRAARRREKYVRFAILHPTSSQLMFQRPLKGTSGELKKAARACFLPLEEAIASADERGLLRAPLRKAEVALAAWAFVPGGISALAVGGRSLSPRARCGPASTRSRSSSRAAHFASRRGHPGSSRRSLVVAVARPPVAPRVPLGPTRIARGS